MVSKAGSKGKIKMQPKSNDKTKNEMSAFRKRERKQNMDDWNYSSRDQQTTYKHSLSESCHIHEFRCPRVSLFGHRAKNTNKQKANTSTIIFLSVSL